MKIIPCQQGTLEWFELHRGVPTASNFSRIITPKTAKLATGAARFVADLIGQVLTTNTMMPDSYVSQPMKDGIMMEPQARTWYEMERNVDVEQVGFIITDDGRFGCSPDALVGTDGALELKCPTPGIHAQYLLSGGALPSEYAAQVHGELIVTERAWVDFVSYCPGLTTLIVRVTPNKYTDKLRKALDDFWDLYQDALLKIRALGPTLEPVPEPVMMTVGSLEAELPDYLKGKPNGKT